MSASDPRKDQSSPKTKSPPILKNTTTATVHQPPSSKKGKAADASEKQQAASGSRPGREDGPSTSKQPPMAQTERHVQIEEAPKTAQDNKDKPAQKNIPQRKGEKSRIRTILYSVARFFGVVDELNLHLWRESFERRIRENDVGLSLRNSFGCLIPVFHKLQKKSKDPRRVQENKTVQKGRDIDKRGDNRKELPPGDGGYGYAGDGLAYYFYLQKIESLIPQDATGEPVPTFRQKNIVELCKQMFIQTEDMPENELVRLNQEITEQLRPKPYHLPFFIIGLTVLQLAALVITIIMSGIETVGVHPQVELYKDIITFRGKENVDVWVRPNIWIGAPMYNLIAEGAVYSPCMRTDWGIARILKEQSFGYGELLGCCEVAARGIAGTTTEKECGILTVDGGHWHDKPCSETRPNSTIILRPCCFGLLGNCKMTTEKGCKIHKGHFFKSGPEHCSQAFCFPFFCGNTGLERSHSLPFMPSSSNQGWRLLISIIFHAGILHFVLIALVQWILGRPIEGQGGWLRLGLIYLTTSIGSNLVGAFFDPYLPQTGCSGGVFGLIGISLIEVGQAHRSLVSLKKEIIGLLVVALVLIVAGFFPLMNNFVHLGGLLFGIPIGILFLPHLCFNTWSCRRRRLLVGISAAVLFVMVFVFFGLFYLIQDTGFCKYCYIASCIPITNRMCDIQMDLIGTITRD